VNHDYAWRLAIRFFRSERMRMGGVYLMLAEKYKGVF